MSRSFIASVVMCASSVGFAQCDLTWSADQAQNFAGTNGTVHAAVSFDPDGPGPQQELLVIAGPFTIAGSTQQLAGLAAFDGQQWIPMDGPAFDAPPKQLHVIQGRLYATGGFVRRHDEPGQGVAEFDVEGWVWRAVAGDSGVSGGVNGTVVDSDVLGNELVVAGSFTMAGTNPEIPARNIAAWNGQTWREVGVQESSGNGGLDQAPSEIVAYENTKILARSSTWNLLENGTWRQLPSPGFNMNRLHVVNQRPTVLFDELMAGTHLFGAYQWNPQGWTLAAQRTQQSFDLAPALSYSISARYQPNRPGAFALSVHSGRFATGPAIATLTTNEGTDPNTNPFAGTNAILWRGQPVITGDFDWFERIPSSNIITRTNGNWQPLHAGTSGPASKLLNLETGIIAVRSRFIEANFTTADIFKLDSSSNWSLLSPESIQSPCIFQDMVEYQGKPVVSGDFNIVTPPSTQAQPSNLIMFNGTRWVSLLSNFQLNEIFIHEGQLHATGGTPFRVSKYIESSGQWETVPWQITSITDSVTVDGTLHAFIRTATQPVDTLSKLVGTQWVSLPSPPSGWIAYDLASNDRELFVAMRIDSGSLGSSHFIASWDGTQWTTLGPIAPPSRSTRSFTDIITWSGDLYASGQYLNVGELSAAKLARWDGQQWWDVGADLKRRSGTRGAVYSLAPGSTSLALSGDFETAGEHVAAGFVQLQRPTGACAIDLNCDWGIDGSDVEAFFVLYEAGNIRADLDDSGDISNDDIVTFFTAFANGC